MNSRGHGRRLTHRDQIRELRAIHDEVSRRAVAERPVVVLDLDSTILDNRPRTLAILRELAQKWHKTRPAEAEALRELDNSSLHFLVEDSLASVGIRSAVLLREARLFWRERFFSGDLLHLDMPYPGALRFARQCHDAGATLVYFTARDLPQMGIETVRSLHTHHFPFAVPRVELVMKPSAEAPDVDFKSTVARELRSIGVVVAAFDNEPHHCNSLKDAHPAATVCLMDTQHLPDAPPLRDDVIVLGGFDGEE